MNRLSEVKEQWTSLNFTAFCKVTHDMIAKKKIIFEWAKHTAIRLSLLRLFSAVILYHLHLSHNTPYLPPKLCITVVNFFPGYYGHPKRNKREGLCIFFWGGGCIMGGVKMVNKLCLEMLYCTCMKSPYRDDKKAKAMATLSVYNIKAKKREENRNETVT